MNCFELKWTILTDLHELFWLKWTVLNWSELFWTQVIIILTAVDIPNLSDFLIFLKTEVDCSDGGELFCLKWAFWSKWTVFTKSGLFSPNGRQFWLKWMMCIIVSVGSSVLWSQTVTGWKHTNINKMTQFAVFKPIPSFDLEIRSWSSKQENTCERSKSAWERRIALHKSDQQQQNCGTKLTACSLSPPTHPPPTTNCDMQKT